MQATDAYQDSKRNAIESLSKEEVVIKLFEEAEKQLKMAMILIEHKNYVRSYNCVAKGQKIISSLNLSLDMQYPISVELTQIYSFIYEKMGEANVSRDTQLMSDLLVFVKELKEAFKEAERLTNPSNARVI